LNIYHNIFEQLLRDPRANSRQISEKIGRGLGTRGRSHNTIRKHYLNMKERKITKDPAIILKPFKEHQTKILMCVKDVRRGVKETFYELSKKKEVEYIMHLAGDFDYFIATRHEINLSEHQVRIVNEDNLFAPIFTIPCGWNDEYEKCFKKLNRFKFDKKEGVNRQVRTKLEWNETHWKIYNITKRNIRQSFYKVGRKIGIDHKTVKKYFYDNILPKCGIYHYFWPFGYDNYMQSFIRLKTEYEREMTKALSLLPCTTYIYPLREEICLLIFHENNNRLMSLFQKWEEEGIICRYVELTPIWKNP
jgi:DNA-binding Lrp family transcriptional regulator